MKYVAAIAGCLLVMNAHAQDMGVVRKMSENKFAHVHQFKCTSACTGFVSSDTAFDIHYVDAAGKEVPLEAALAKKK